MPRVRNLRKKVRRRRIETVLLAGYAFAVVCAIFVALLHKNHEEEIPIAHYEDGFDFGADIFMPAFNDAVDNNPFELAYTQINSIKLLSDYEFINDKFVISHNDEKEVVMPGAPKPKKYHQYGSMDGIYRKERHVVMVESGDTFIGILNRLGMESKNATEAYNALKKVYDTRRLRVGQYFLLTGIFNIQNRMLETLESLSIEPERGVKYILTTNEYDKFETKVEREKFLTDYKVVSGTVSGSVDAAFANAGLPRAFRYEIPRIFAHMLNLNRDIRKGDQFEVKYQVSKTATGEVVKIGSLMYASFKTSRQTYKLYRFKNEFYDAKGQAKKTGLDKKPLAARNARISSLFGYRRHPIYKTTKFHSGVDYAAPKGTAIYASGNGVVEMARYVNGYGNFVKIRHNSEYETAYGHMNGYAKGIRPGVRVRKGQVIGYVGSTGRSTGPHLHFEIIRNGQRINPLNAKVATGNDLTGAQLNEFRRVMRQVDAAKETIFKTEPKPLETAKKPEEPLETQSADTNDAATQKDVLPPVPVLPSVSELRQLAAESANQPIADGTVQTDKAEQEKTLVAENKTDQKQVQETAVTEQVQKEQIAVQETSAAENSADLNYKGKRYYPVRISAVQARQKYLPAKQTYKGKIIMPVKSKRSTLRMRRRAGK